MESGFPEIAARAMSTAAEEALCLMHLESVCRRVGVKPLTRTGFSSLYLGEYEEIRNHFSGWVDVKKSDVITFLRDVPVGKRFRCASVCVSEQQQMQCSRRVECAESSKLR